MLTHFRRCSFATKGAHRRLWSSVHLVGVGYSEPLIKESRLRRLEPLCQHLIQAPTLKQEPSPSTTGRRAAPITVK